MQFTLVPNACLRMMPYLFLWLLPAALPSQAAEVNEAQPASYLTLQGALDLALRANPEIAVAVRERESVEGAKVQANALLNPSLAASIQDTKSATRQTLLQINQELEIGHKRQARIEAADFIYSKAAAELEHKKTDIHASVVAAFYEVLVAQERLSLAKSSADIAQLARDAANKRVLAGKSSPVEETKSKLAESAAKIELGQATTQLTVSRKRLSSFWGNTSPVFENVKGQVANIPDLAPLNELTAMLENAPAVKVAKAEMDARGSIIKVERSKGAPNITVSVGIINNQELGRNQALIGLSVPLPIFDRNQGNLQQAVSRKYKAQDELAALKNQLDLALTHEYERLSSARQSAALLQAEILPGAQSAFDAANKGFNLGKFNFLDVLDAQRTLVLAKSQYINTLLDAHQAVAAIERILGDVIVHHDGKH